MRLLAGKTHLGLLAGGSIGGGEHLPPGARSQADSFMVVGAGAVGGGDLVRIEVLSLVRA